MIIPDLQSSHCRTQGTDGCFFSETHQLFPHTHLITSHIHAGKNSASSNKFTAIANQGLPIARAAKITPMSTRLYEQKAVAVLLDLLNLGVKGIRLGPTLPAFLSPNVVKGLVENFNIIPAGDATEDVAAIMARR